MDKCDAKRILADVRFPGYSFVLHGDFVDGKATYLQGVFTAPDNDQPRVMRPQHTRKWLLSQHMTRSELVQTAFKCVLTSIEHEARERFTYKGARVFGPHFDVEVLAAACYAAAPDLRKEPA
jgi:hypothetical protein